MSKTMWREVVIIHNFFRKVVIILLFWRFVKIKTNDPASIIQKTALKISRTALGLRFFEFRHLGDNFSARNLPLRMPQPLRMSVFKKWQLQAM